MVLTTPRRSGTRGRAVPTPLLKDGWLMPDALWALVVTLLPARKKHPLGCHNPRSDDRKAMNTILYVLRTATPWNSLPRGCPDFCGRSSAYRRFREWTDAGVFKKLWELSLEKYDEFRHLDWRFLALDGSITKAPCGGEATGKNPTDRAKKGTKRSLVTDAAGIPVGLAVSGANTADCKMVEETLESMPREWPADMRPLMCMDKGYDGRPTRLVLDVYGLRDGIIKKRKKGEKAAVKKPRPAGHKPRRYVVEQAHAWMNGFRRVKIRWERRLDTYVAMLHLSMSLVTFQRLTGGRGDPPRLNRKRDHRDEKHWKKSPRRPRRKGPLPAWELPRLPGAA